MTLYVIITGLKDLTEDRRQKFNLHILKFLLKTGIGIFPSEDSENAVICISEGMNKYPNLVIILYPDETSLRMAVVLARECYPILVVTDLATANKIGELPSFEHLLVDDDEFECWRASFYSLRCSGDVETKLSKFL